MHRFDANLSWENFKARIEIGLFFCNCCWRCGVMHVATNVQQEHWEQGYWYMIQEFVTIFNDKICRPSSAWEAWTTCSSKDIKGGTGVGVQTMDGTAPRSQKKARMAYLWIVLIKPFLLRTGSFLSKQLTGFLLVKEDWWFPLVPRSTNSRRGCTKWRMRCCLSFVFTTLRMQLERRSIASWRRF